MCHDPLPLRILETSFTDQSHSIYEHIIYLYIFVGNSYSKLFLYIGKSQFHQKLIMVMWPGCPQLFSDHHLYRLLHFIYFKFNKLRYLRICKDISKWNWYIRPWYYWKYDIFRCCKVFIVVKLTHQIYLIFLLHSILNNLNPLLKIVNNLRWP